MWWWWYGNSPTKCVETYPEQVSAIDCWLKSRKLSDTHTPGCGGVHNHDDVRIRSALIAAKSSTIIRTVTEDTRWLIQAQNKIKEQAYKQMISLEEAEKVVKVALDEALNENVKIIADQIRKTRVRSKK